MSTRRRDEDGDVPEFDELTEGHRDGAGSDERVDPAMAPVIEAGGGVAEGFEQSEAALEEKATAGPEEGEDYVEEDAPAPEAEPDRGTYGEADHEHHGDDS
jgi:hypothetical protein